MTRNVPLHLVAPPEEAARTSPGPGDDGSLGDVALTATIFAIAFMPLVGAVAHVGHWGQGELGLGAAGSMFAGRELWTCARAALRARRHR